MRLIDRQCSRLGCLTALATLAVFLSLGCPLAACAQDSPGHFEVGGNFTALRFNGAGNFGPGLEGDFNFGRHFALDAAFNWLPATRYSHVVQGLFGGKAGMRTEHFGLFGKVRAGFISRGNQLREEIANVGPFPLGQPIPPPIIRFGRLTERALDFGGVFEYYPAKHWALRYDFGDTVVFGEGAQIHIFGDSFNFNGPPGNTTHNFQFSTSVHYRF
jgi:hypothetical protein